MAKGSTAAQKFVPVKEVRDGIAILDDGSMHITLIASSINFALKSADEQRAILGQFQKFLNTLDFSLQIYVQSRELDIKPYLDLLATREERQDNDLMKTQLREYIGFIRSFTEDVDIMAKSFFVSVPYSPAKVNVGKSVKGIGGLFKKGKKQDAATLDTARFEEHRSQLEQRVTIVQQGLGRVGVRSIPLGTEEVVDLFYHLFNPGETSKAAAL